MNETVISKNYVIIIATTEAEIWVIKLLYSAQ